MKILFPKEIRSNYDGYRQLLGLYGEIKDCLADDVVIDFQKTIWFDANLLSVLGAILNKTEENLNKIELVNIKCGAIELLWQRNHFLSHFGGYKLPDFQESTIKYRKFKITEEKVFKDYLDSELLSKNAMSEMTPLLRKKINESIFEIFNNAVIHGNCKNIFSCGQYYRKHEKLDFTIVNLGTTIKANVKNYLKKKLNQNSISWAVKEGNTTKKGNIPGGLGLSLIRSFSTINQGKIQIVSADEYLEQDESGQIRTEILQGDFPGTIVNLEFNLTDPHSYCLASEQIEPKDIF
ncbi:MAG: ATP-binding protein [Bacillota bacterium]|jgi:hypothetical protein